MPGSDMVLPEELVTGHPEVDAQHAAILAELERLRATSPDGVWVSIAFLTQHAKAHFSYEEMLMDAVGYPETLAHRREHRNLLETLGELTADLEREGATQSNLARVVDEVERWVTVHVLRSDRQLAEFVRKH